MLLPESPDPGKSAGIKSFPYGLFNDIDLHWTPRTIKAPNLANAKANIEEKPSSAEAGPNHVDSTIRGQPLRLLVKFIRRKGTSRYEQWNQQKR
jgi:hypothetical protein